MILPVPTPDPDNATPVQRFRAPAVVWDAFARICSERSIRHARRLIDLMAADIRRYGTDEDRAALAEAIRELKDRRSRRPSQREK
jgi:hypothetical protein